MKNPTKSEIEWLVNEALAMQGCLPPDECEENRAHINRLGRALKEMRKRDQAGAGRDALAIAAFLQERGLQVAK